MNKTALTIMAALAPPVVGVAVNMPVEAKDVVAVTTEALPGKQCTVALNPPVLALLGALDNRTLRRFCNGKSPTLKT